MPPSGYDLLAKESRRRSMTKDRKNQIEEKITDWLKDDFAQKTAEMELAPNAKANYQRQQSAE